MRILWDLFLCFFQIGACSIGGGYATISMIQTLVVQQHQWLSEQSFVDMITISQMTPGPLAINTSTFAGMQVAGLPGAVVATIGCILVGVSLSLTLYIFLQKHKENMYIQLIRDALKSISAGLIAFSCLSILSIAFISDGELYIPSVFSVLICLYLLRRYHLSPMVIMLLSGCIGLITSLF